MPRLNNNLDRAIGARLRTQRLQAGLTQSDLGKSIAVTFQRSIRR